MIIAGASIRMRRFRSHQRSNTVPLAASPAADICNPRAPVPPPSLAAVGKALPDEGDCRRDADDYHKGRGPKTPLQFALPVRRRLLRSDDLLDIRLSVLKGIVGRLGPDDCLGQLDTEGVLDLRPLRVARPRR